MKKLSLVFLGVAVALVFAAPALASNIATYTLTTTNPTVAPGGSVTFDGTIVAASTNLGNLYAFSDDYTLPIDFTIDDTDFFVDVPYPLTPGQSYTGPLFTITTQSTDAPGTYDGAFDISFENNAAGKNLFTDNAQFEVSVGSPSSVTPEPGSWLLLGTGLTAVWLLRLRLFTHALNA